MTCDIFDCDYPAVSRGLCRKHYDRARYQGLLPNVKQRSDRRGDPFERVRVYVCEACGHETRVDGVPLSSSRCFKAVNGAQCGGRIREVVTT